MGNYYCPYCRRSFQVNNKRTQVSVNCEFCGEKLQRVSFFKPVKLIGLLAAIAFISPLILMIASSLQEEIYNSPSEKILTKAY